MITLIILLNILINLKNAGKKSQKNKKGNRRLLLRSGATCIVPGLTLNFVARISVESLHDLWWASKNILKIKNICDIGVSQVELQKCSSNDTNLILELFYEFI